MSSVAFAVWLARFFTSDATTAKPLPASPARAASIVAFSASRLVCPAMVLIRPTTSPIFCAPSANVLTMPSVRLASCTALSAISEDCATWRAISEIDADSSSAAEATVCTLTLACLDRRGDVGRLLRGLAGGRRHACAPSPRARSPPTPPCRPAPRSSASKSRSRHVEPFGALLPLGQQRLLIDRDRDVHVEHDAGIHRGDQRRRALPGDQRCVRTASATRRLST